MQKQVLLSVAISTRNRPESLSRCLKSLRAQSLQPYEIVVSDDSDAPFSHEVRKIAMDMNCRYVVGPQRGVFANRNRAALACKGPHVRNMDDDREFPEGHCEAIQKAVESDPESVWILSETSERPLPFSILYVPGEIQPTGISMPPRDWEYTFAISDGSVVYPKEIFQTHCYLEVFPFGSAYLEFGARLKSLGYRIRYLTTTYVIHHSQSLPSSFHDRKIFKKSSFLCAHLTYSCYLPNIIKSSQCFLYFFVCSILSHFKIKDCGMNLSDFLEVLRLVKKYSHYFKTKNYKMIC